MARCFDTCSRKERSAGQLARARKKEFSDGELFRRGKLVDGRATALRSGADGIALRSEKPEFYQENVQ